MERFVLVVPVVLLVLHRQFQCMLLSMLHSMHLATMFLLISQSAVVADQ